MNLLQAVTLDAVSKNTQGVPIACKGYTTAVFQVSGALNGLVNFMGSVDGINFAPIGCSALTDNKYTAPLVPSATTPGLWRADITGINTFIRADLTNYVSGEVTVTVMMSS